MAWLTVVVVVLVAVTSVSGRAQQGQSPGHARPLFEARGQAADAAATPPDRTKKRGRRVHVNAGALQQANAPGNDIVTLNLFDDVQLRARRRQVEVTGSGGTVWKGRLLDVAGEATFAVQDGVMSGTVFAGDKVFEVLYAGGGEHEVRELESSGFPTDDPQADLAPVEPDPQAGAMDAAVAAAIAGDAASQIDVMVIWTPAARSAAGGTSAIQSLVNLAVANTNTAYANSAVTQRLRLVYAGEMSYTEAAPSTDLSRMALAADGYLDSVHALRTTYGADVVTLLGEGYVNTGACGVGYLMTNVSTGFATNAFNVVDRSCAAGNLSYAHELGHNMGLQHDPSNANGSGAYSYAYGYQHPAGAFRTIMAYPCPTGSCPRLTYFANPSVSYNSMPTGTATQNTALALNNTASSVANFRQAVTGTCAYSLGSTSRSVSSGASTASVAVTAGSGCAWTAASNASWLSITTGASGSGNGTVGYTVAPNTVATARTGVITIAGRTLTITQAAAACAYALSPSSASVSAWGATGSVLLTTLTGCTASAISNASWITVTSGATGSSSRTVTYSVATNSSGSARSGTIGVQGQLFTVSQPKRGTGSPANSAKADFNGDSMADLLWQNDNGAVGLWKMNGLAAAEIVMLTPGQVDPVWKMVGSGDLDGDGKPEIVWQHQAGGWLCAWFMNGQTMQQVVFLTPNRVDTGAWQIVAIADLNGDARADLILQHEQGALVVWYMNGSTRIGLESLNPSAIDGNDWKIVGAGDVNGDVKPDLIWQQSSSGLIGAWLMNGATATSMVLLNPSQVSTAWKIRGVVDLDGDGQTDLVWQHDNGALGVWLMAGITATSMQAIAPSSVPTTWRLVGPR